MRKIIKTIVLLFILSPLWGQSWQISDKYRAEAPFDSDKYGTSVGINTNFYFIGASLDDEAEVGIEDETGSNGGAVYVYDKDNYLTQKLFPSIPMKSAYFGNSLAATEQTLVIGAYYGRHDTASTAKEGLAYVFELDEYNEWVERKVLKQDSAASYDLFGRDIAIDGDYILVSANGEDEIENSSGAAYIFYRHEGGDNNWGQQTKLKATIPQKSAYMGWSADLDGDYAILGAYKYDSIDKEDIGAAHIFKNTDGVWTEQQLLIPNGSADSKAGYDVAIHNTLALVSAPYESVNNTTESGVVYLYQLNSNIWELAYTFKLPIPQEGANYGHKVDINESYIAITSKNYDENDGSVFIYSTTDYSLLGELSTEENFSYNELGASVALFDKTCLVGASHGESSQGAAYTFNYNLFSKQITDIDNYNYASIDWGDYDNDGDKDFIISGAIDIDGDTYADQSVTHLYNNHNGIFTLIETPNIAGQHLGAVKFIDIDYDNDLDIISCGQSYQNLLDYPLYVYENQANEFTLKQTLDGTIYSSIDVGDYDNDGDLDLLLTGAYQSNAGAGVKTVLFSNEHGTLTEEELPILGVQNGDAQFGDFDLDQDLDILIMGNTDNGDYILQVHHNTNGEYSLAQDLPGVYLGSFALADYNNDQYLDFAIMGDNTDDDYTTLAYKYVANQGFELDKTLIGLDNSSGTTPILWGDYDNDGQYDLVAAGTDIDYEDRTHLWLLKDTTFTFVEEGLLDVGGSTSLATADIDNDNDLDMLVSGFYSDSDFNYLNGTVLHQNDSKLVNQAPAAPSNLTSAFDQTTQQISFTWDMGTDDKTTAEGLFYWFTLQEMGSDNIIASYPVQGTSWTIKGLELGNYDWAIQSIDAAYVLSEKTTASIMPTSTVSTFDKIGFNIYPNPTTSHIALDTEEPIIAIRIYNNLGEIVLQPQVASPLNVSHLPTGTYIIELKTNDDVLISKFIKN